MAEAKRRGTHTERGGGPWTPPWTLACLMIHLSRQHPLTSLDHDTPPHITDDTASPRGTDVHRLLSRTTPPTTPYLWLHGTAGKFDRDGSDLTRGEQQHNDIGSKSCSLDVTMLKTMHCAMDASLLHDLPLDQPPTSLDHGPPPHITNDTVVRCAQDVLPHRPTHGAMCTRCPPPSPHPPYHTCIYTGFTRSPTPLPPPSCCGHHRRHQNHRQVRPGWI
nr:unnamed protein product [Digitaria exilis]